MRHDMIEKSDMSALGTILYPDATIRSPMAINPYKSADAVILAIATATIHLETLPISANPPKMTG
jgi:hypothetical protein